MALDARCYFEIGKPKSCPMNRGTDTNLEASVQHHSLIKAEYPGETEASESQSDETHNTPAPGVSN